MEHRGGQPDDARKADVGDEHTGCGKKARDGRVGDAGEQGVEILPHAGDEPDAGIEARQEEDGRQQHLPRPAEKGAGKGRQGLGSGGAVGIGGPGQRAGMGQHGVNDQQQPAR